MRICEVCVWCKFILIRTSEVWRSCSMCPLPLLPACPGKRAVYYHCCTLAKFFKLNKNTKEYKCMSCVSFDLWKKKCEQFNRNFSDVNSFSWNLLKDLLYLEWQYVAEESDWQLCTKRLHWYRYQNLFPIS